MPSAKANVRRITVRVPDGDVSAAVIRGVGFRFVCSCGERGARRADWTDARADMREHLLGHEAYLAWAPGG